MTSSIVVFGALLAFWLALSWPPSPLSAALGVVAAAVVTRLNRDLDALGPLLRAGPRLALYVPWLLWQIVVANVQVARIVLHPRLPIDPVVIRFTAPLSGDLARTTLGNSITLTPGTITLDVDRATFVVHALTTQGAREVTDGRMARRVARVFAEDVS
ncbi:MAG: Na+/H+ antiporter subunit E [Candidatus Rokuibacteriota bacterium]